MKKKLSKIILIVLVTFSVIVGLKGTIDAAPIGNMTTVSTGYNYSWSSSSPINGMTSGYAQLDRIYADRVLNTCFDPATATGTGAGYNSEPMVMDAIAIRLNRAAIANNIEGMNDETYAAWQLYQHSIMYASNGFTVTSTNVPNLSGYFAQFEAKTTSYWTKPTFNFGDGTIKSGETKTYNVTNGITGGWSAYYSSTGVTVTFSSGVLTVVNNNTTSDTISIELKKEVGQYKRLAMIYDYPGHQRTGSFGVPDPDFAQYNLTNLRKGDLEIVKVDNLGNKVSGVTFSVSKNSDMSSPFASVTTGANGSITETGIDIGDVYVQEKAVREPLTIDRTIHKVTILPNQTVTFNQTNQRVTGTAILKKVDKDTGGTTPLGEARLDDAVYELRALEDTNDAITGTKILSKDQLIKTETIGSDLTMTVSGLQPARYYFIEKNEATGYLLDSEKHIVDLRYVDDATAVVEKETTSYQQVIRGNIKIQKFINTEGTGIKFPEPGAVFTVQLEKDVKAMGEANAPIYATITTDLLGQGEAKNLPWAGIEGYRVTQTTAMNENLEMIEPFNSKIVNNGETIFYIVGNELHTSYLQVLKYDADLGEAIVFPATFKIYDVSNDEWYSEVVGNKLIEEWTTDETGMLITNKVLPAGDYRLVETGVPTNYLQPDEDIPFTITASNVHETNIDGKPIYVIRVSNQAPKGSLTLNKVFERVEGLHDDELLESGWKATFVNDVIANYDGETVLFSAGEQFVNPNSADGLWYANEDTELLIEDIYVGHGEGTTLKFDEEVYPEGYVQAGSFTETFTKDETDNTTKVIEISRKVENKVIRTDIEVVKTDLYSNEVVKGIFGFEITSYLDEELTEVYDTQFVNPFTGKAVFTDVAYGTTLYFSETATHESYYLSDEVIKVVVDKTLENIGEVYSFTYANRPVPTIGTTATGINGLKTLDPSIENEMTDISDVKNIDIDKTYTTHVKFWKYDESGNGNHKVVLEDVYNDITFEEADTTFTSKLLAEANTLEEGRYYFTETFYEDGKDNPETDTPIVEHNDPEDDGQTLHMEKTKYTIEANKVDSVTKNNIKSKDFVFEFTGYKDGKKVDSFEKDGNTNTGIATFKFAGTGTYDYIEVKEVGAPKGYLLSDEVKKVSLKDFDENNLYSFKYVNVLKPSAAVASGDTTQTTLFTGLGVISLVAIAFTLKKNRKVKG